MHEHGPTKTVYLLKSIGADRVAWQKSAMTTLDRDRTARHLLQERNHSFLLFLLLVFFLISGAVPSTQCFVITLVGKEKPSIHPSGFSITANRRIQRTSSLAVSSAMPPTTPIGTGAGSNDLQDLKASIDIVEVVDSYNLPKFRRTDTGAVACCPFHDDNNPSMRIDTTRQWFKCFSCGESGDVFHFVQEHSRLQGQEELTFGQVVQMLDTRFGDGSFAFTGNRKPSVPPEQHEKEKLRKERCLMANAAAASFFSDSLTRVSSGAARWYLRTRGVSARTVRTFALGYASGDKKDLCSHLQELNFTAFEVVDAGLAITVKKRQNVTSATNATTGIDHGNLEYDDIVDKFNNRIIVPILDESGKKVLGFGGRTISPEQEEITESKFKAPKYLNSPETPVFSKSNILFGRFLATEAMHEVTSRSSQRPTIVMVEGYMDAIALWEAGYRTAVATMGTAVSQKQLDSAARIVSGIGGRVILCLDSDKAGFGAMERLCSNGMLATSAKKFKADIFIASLPGGLKDPGDYAAMFRNEVNFDEKFEKEVVDAAEDWVSWYISTIIRQYSKSAPRGGRNSFSDIFSRVADFIGTTMDTADRTKAALDVSHLLSELLKTDRNSTEISKNVQIQLEADLIDLSARSSYSSNALSQRVEQTATSISGSKEAKLKMSDLMKGDLVTVDTKRESKPQSSGRKRLLKPRRKLTMKRAKREDASLTPFFSGFDFKHKSDIAWLTGSNSVPKWRSRNNNSLLLGSPDADSLSSSRFGEPVFFNSVDFNGNQFLSDEAVDAGYERGPLKPEKSVVTTGIASLVKRDYAQAGKMIENAILTTLVKSNDARRIAREFLQSRPSFSIENMAWSVPQKRWMFDTLVFKERSFKLGSSISDTRSLLMNHGGVPPKSFQRLHNAPDQSSVTIDTIEAANDAVLEQFFSETTDDDSIIEEHLPHLRIQELLGEFLWISSFLQVEKIRSELQENSYLLPAESSENNVTRPILEMNSTLLVDDQGNNHNQAIELQTNQAHFLNLSLAGDLRDAINSAQSLKQASARIISNVMDESLTTGIGKLSLSKRKKLVNEVGQYVHNISQSHTLQVHTPAIISELVSKEEDDECFEERLEQLADEWGDWLDEDYVWSADHTEESTRKAMSAFKASVFPDQTKDLDDDEDESIEEFNARIALEYSEWDDPS